MDRWSSNSKVFNVCNVRRGSLSRRSNLVGRSTLRPLRGQHDVSVQDNLEVFQMRHCDDRDGDKTENEADFQV